VEGRRARDERIDGGVWVGVELGIDGVGVGPVAWVGGWLLSWQKAANELAGMNTIGNNGHGTSLGAMGH